MRVKEKGKGEELEVYRVYWVNGKRHFSVIFYHGYPGLSSLTEDECEVVDPILNDRFALQRHGDGTDALVHWAAYENNLLDNLLDHQPEAMAEFERRLRENYRKDERFPGSPPLDMLHKSKSYPDATSREDDYYFCPECCEANQKKRDYDEAIRCQTCDRLYNCVP